MELRESFKINETVKIDVFRSAGLIWHTQYLARLASDSSLNKMELVSLCTGVVLMGAAALESLLMEAAFLLNTDLYQRKAFRKAGVTQKYKMLMGQCPDYVERIWKYRIAVTHSEPDNQRSRYVGEIINVKGAVWIAQTLDLIAKDIWGSSVPKWFSETLSLNYDNTRDVNQENT